VPGNWFCVTPEKATALARYNLRANDIVVSRSGTVGEACLITSGHEPLLMSTNLMRMRTLGQSVSGLWLVVNFKGNRVIAGQLEQLCKGSTRPFLNLEILSALLVRLAPIAEQERVIEQLQRAISDINAIKSIVDSEISRRDRLRQSILKRAFEGKLVPQDPNDAPASMLLERIRAERNKANKS
jgi:type I restriction enzyme S subunit